MQNPARQAMPTIEIRLLAPLDAGVAEPIDWGADVTIGFLGCFKELRCTRYY
jgi:hypothetical protein